MSEETTTIYPTVLLRVDEAEGTMNTVTINDGDTFALLVFGGEDDARGYQRDTGKHTAEEGFGIFGMGRDGIASLLDKQGIDHVALTSPWTGNGPVDLFTAGNFLELLDTAQRVG